MNRFAVTLTALALPLAITAMTPLPAAAQQAAEQDRVYGSQLMTEQERNEYRAQMRNAETQADRDQLRAEHHARMQERAKEMGVTLPDAPPARGMGGGPRMGGQGMGPRSGTDMKPGMSPGGGYGTGRGRGG